MQPLGERMETWAALLPAGLLKQAAAAAFKKGPCLTVGTVCSGFDGALHVVKALNHIFQEALDQEAEQQNLGVFLAAQPAIFCILCNIVFATGFPKYQRSP